MEINCHSMVLYCDCYIDVTDTVNREALYVHKATPQEYRGETREECREKARTAGWEFCLDGRTLCPKHSGKAAK